MAVSIQATSPGLIGPPVTVCGAWPKNAPATLTAAIRRNGNAENSRIRSVLRRTVANVIAKVLRCARDVTRNVPVVHESYDTPQGLAASGRRR